MKRIITAAICTFIWLGRPAHAADIQVIGEGAQHCTAWTSAKSDTGLQTYLAMQAWVRGFVGAFVARKNVKIDVSGLTVWIDDICAVNPSVWLYTAANEYVEIHVHPDRPLHSVATGRDDFTVSGEGAQRCTAWTNARNSSASPMYVVMDAWVRGFVTAFVVDKETKIDVVELTKWIDDSCRSNPPWLIYMVADEYVMLHVPDPDHPLIVN